MAVLLRFRQNKIAWTADITQAFLQLGIQKEHAQVVRFLWLDLTETLNPKIVKCRWKRVPFGLTCSPFILKAVILKFLDDNRDGHRTVADRMPDQLYVDDWIDGTDTVENAVKMITEAREMLKNARMDLRKWTTNSAELMMALKGTLEFDNDIKDISKAETTKTLGVVWDPKKDIFMSKPDEITADAALAGPRPTKRRLFSLALRVFDPLGLVSPATVVGNIICRKSGSLKQDGMSQSQKR